MTQVQSLAAPFDAMPIADRARQVFDANNAVQLATLGGTWSPWILGAYFARAPRELQRPNQLREQRSVASGEQQMNDLDLVLMVERHGKTMSNLVQDPRVAFSVSKNDATQDFIQGSGTAELLADDAAVMAALKAKMPWYQLYTPCAPVRINVRELFVTSFELGWMPARRITIG